MTLQRDFVEALLKEIDLRKSYIDESVSTIYFGGGTPSLLPTNDIKLIIAKIYSTYKVNHDAEITLEANPDDINSNNLQQWKLAGINRLSIGVQSFFQEDLQWMNRAHNALQATECIELAQKHGFHNLSIDLIYGTPTLTNEKWQQNLEIAFSNNIPHLSCYALTVEPKTALEKMIEKKQVNNVNTDSQLKHFQMLMQMTSANNYEQYELSNFSKKDFQSRHNSSYWRHASYIGLGPAAHSYDKKSRQWNVANNALYINALKKGELLFEMETLSIIDQLNEYIMTSLRTIEGLSLAYVEINFGHQYAAVLIENIQKQLERNTIRVVDGSLQLTAEGKFLADGISSDLFFTSPLQNVVDVLV